MIQESNDSVTQRPWPGLYELHGMPKSIEVSDIDVRRRIFLYICYLTTCWGQNTKPNQQKNCIDARSASKRTERWTMFSNEYTRKPHGRGRKKKKNEEREKLTRDRPLKEQMR